MIKFSCKQCGDCCKRLGASDSKEVNEIKEAVSYSDDELTVSLNDIDGLPLFEWEAKVLLDRNPSIDIKPKTGVYDAKSKQIIVTSYVLNHKECPFLAEKKCSIHSEWPSLCKAYPLVSVGYSQLVNGLKPKVLVLGCNNKEYEISEDIRGLYETFGDCFLAALQREMNHEMIEYHVKKLMNSGRIMVGKLPGDAKMIGLFDFMVNEKIISKEEHDKIVSGAVNELVAERQVEEIIG